MKSKITKIVLCVLAVLLIAFAFWRNYDDQRKELKRLEANQESLMRSIEKVPVTDSTYALDVARLTLKVDELIDYNENVTKLCNRLDLKMKRLESASSSSSVTDVSAVTHVHDTIIKFIENTPVHANAFNWNDNYVHINGLIKDDSVKCNVMSYDTITQLVYRVPRQWLCFKFGTKAVKQFIYSSNPHTRLTYSEYIEVKRE